MLTLDTKEMEMWLVAYAARRKVAVQDAINRKLGWTIRRAIWYTPEASYVGMARQLGQKLRLRGRNKIRFRAHVGKWNPRKRPDGTKTAPLLALIINKRRGKKGQKGLYGSAMSQQFRKVWGARARSVAYLKSGWLEAFNEFKPWATGGSTTAPPVSSTPKRVGRPKGYGKRSESGAAVFAVAANQAWTRKQKDAGLRKFAAAALKKAYDQELKDTVEYLSKELKDTANKISPNSAR